VFLLQGRDRPPSDPDPFLAQRETGRLVGEWLSGHDPDARQTLRGTETTWAGLVDAARTGSLFSTRRALVVRQAEGLKGDGAEMVSYLARENPDVRIVLVPTSRPDGRRPIWKRVAEAATVVVLETPRWGALHAFVREEARRVGLRLERDAVEEIAERFGQDLWRVVGELEKIRTWSGDAAASLSAEDIAPVVGRSLGPPLQNLADAVFARDMGKAAELVEAALEDREAPPRLVATVHRAFRRVRVAHGLHGRRGDPKQDARALGLSERQAFLVPDLLEASRRWEEAEIRDALRSLSQADRKMKRSGEARVELLAVLAAARPLRPSPPRGGR
jgi:DNA polymerase-3 subunit delta